MTLSISYSLAGLHEASRFIWEHNKSIPQWPDSPKSVFDVMRDRRPKYLGEPVDVNGKSNYTKE